MPSTSDLKRALRDAGLEVYRTEGDTVHLAERVRENLIMDANVRVGLEGPTVSFYVRADRSLFPGESDDQLHDRARTLGQSAIERGFSERRAFVTDVPDPSDPDKVLEHWYQVEFDKTLDSVDAAVEEARFALSLDKTASR
jgi:hypothetical protein